MKEQHIEETPDSMFPWNEAIELDYEGNQRATILCLSSIHDQLCVIASLLRRKDVTHDQG